MASRRWRALGGAGVVLIGLGGCAGPGAPGHDSTPARTVGDVRFVTFPSCTAMLGSLRRAAAAGTSSYGSSNSPATTFASGAPVPLPTAGAVAAPLSAGPAGSDSAAGGSAAGGSAPQGPAPSFSSTNDQEHGVDEPDVVKTDGNLVVTLRSDRPGLQVTTLGPAPALRGFVALASMAPTGTLLVGGDAVVIGQDITPQPAMPVSYRPTTDVAVVDLHDPDHPTVVRSFSVTGSEVDARLIGTTVELVVRNTPNVTVTPPPGEGQPAGAGNERSSSTPWDWLPVTTSQPGNVQTVAPCTGAGYLVGSTGGPPALDSVSVVPIDPSSPAPGPAATVFADAASVYASADALFVASSPSAAVPVDSPVEVPVDGPVAGTGGPAGGVMSVAPDPVLQQADVTDIAGFDLSEPMAPRYTGSAQVPGTLIGQYAMSEYAGDLRVATTVGQATPPPNEGSAPATASESRVTVLHFSSGPAQPVGIVDGLGAGEKIYAVRFMGPLAYVVTFRQTDPLSVLDLSDPQDPHVSGELSLTGYSTFLQPLAGDQLLGIGESVDSQLRVSGLQLSLFDVHDPQQPSLLDKQVLASATSTAQNDPHALLYWAASNLVVLPVTQFPAWSPDGTAPSSQSFDGAIAYRVEHGALAEAGRIVQPAGSPSATPGGTASPVPGTAAPSAGAAPVAVPPVGIAPFGSSIERALVIGSKLVTVSAAGLLVSDLATFAPGPWLAYS